MKASIMKVYINTIIYLVLSSTMFGQYTDFVVRSNVSLGTAQHQFDYDSGDTYYSSGSGIGVDFGFRHEFKNNFILYSSLGIQLSLIYSNQNANEFTNQSSYNFNSLFFSLGAQYLIDFKNQYVTGFSFGGGINGHKPSKLKRKENDFEFDPISYKYTMGFHTDAKFRVRFSKNIFMEPGMRYRNLGFTYVKENKLQNLLPEQFKKLNVNGIEFYLSFFKRMISKA